LHRPPDATVSPGEWLRFCVFSAVQGGREVVLGVAFARFRR
jgi:hypothetical protein